MLLGLLVDTPPATMTLLVEHIAVLEAKTGTELFRAKFDAKSEKFHEEAEREVHVGRCDAAEGPEDEHGHAGEQQVVLDEHA